MNKPTWHPPYQPTGSSLRRTALELLCASFIVLFQELALIRWLPGQVRVLAYFPNLILISAFLGLGMGCLRAGRRNLLWLWPLSLVVLFGAFAGLSQVVFTHDPESEYLWLLYFDMPKDAPVVHGVYFPIIIAFVMSAISFIPLGQLVAERLNRFAQSKSSLWGYAWDISGSLLGVIGFTVICFAQWFPVLWFAIILGLGFVFFLPKRRLLVVFVPCVAIGLVVVAMTERASVYSPYYAIDTQQRQSSIDVDALFVMTNGSYHQAALRLSNSAPESSPWHKKVKDAYHLPYTQLKKKPRRVAVLGAGTGNDVAVLLDHGAERIDAVEIDPVILDIGRRSHPDRPYDSPRVRAINADARSFLNSCHHKYDLIVFGTLDSMTRLSALSNVRLDNFVYTIEGMRSARNCLTPDGGVVLYFSVSKRYIAMHFLGILASAFDEIPIVRKGNFGLFTRIYMLGPAFAHLKEEAFADRKQQAVFQEQERKFIQETLPHMDIPTDDWPYLYLRSRSVSGFYWLLIAVFLGLAALGVFLFSRQMRYSLTRLGKIDLEMFLFGLAFLLMETKFITEMSLVWGATWLTSAVVFGSILSMVLLATIIMKVKPLPWWMAMGGLLLSLLATYFIPTHFMLGLGALHKLSLSMLLVGTPIFFASACFALRFRNRAHVDLAFGWNLLGAVAGGLMEFFSMAVGLKALALVAVAAYLGVAIVYSRKSRQRPASEK